MNKLRIQAIKQVAHGLITSSGKARIQTQEKLAPPFKALCQLEEENLFQKKISKLLHSKST